MLWPSVPGLRLKPSSSCCSELVAGLETFELAELECPGWLARASRTTAMKPAAAAAAAICLATLCATAPPAAPLAFGLRTIRNG